MSSSSGNSTQSSTTSSRRAIAAARRDATRVAEKTLRPAFLKLFPMESRQAVIDKLVAYHTRMGTDIFLGLSDIIRFRMVCCSKFTGFPRIWCDPPFTANWTEHDVARFAHIKDIWPEYKRLQQMHQDQEPRADTASQTTPPTSPTPAPVTTVDSFAQTDGKQVMIPGN